MFFPFRWLISNLHILRVADVAIARGKWIQGYRRFNAAFIQV